MYHSCVIDSSTLINLTKLRRLDIFNQLRYLFRSIHVPTRVLQEYQIGLSFEPDRQWVIDQLRQPNYGFLSFCTKYDTIALTILATTNGIDAGEAEAAAQHKSIDSQFVLSDDQKFITSIKIADKYTKILTTLHIIALLDFNKIISNHSDYLSALHYHHPFTAQQLRCAYIDIIKQLGIKFSKRELNNKTSFKIIGIKKYQIDH